MVDHHRFTVLDRQLEERLTSAIWIRHHREYVAGKQGLFISNGVQDAANTVTGYVVVASGRSRSMSRCRYGDDNR